MVRKDNRGRKDEERDIYYEQWDIAIVSGRAENQTLLKYLTSPNSKKLHPQKAVLNVSNSASALQNKNPDLLRDNSSLLNPTNSNFLQPI